MLENEFVKRLQEKNIDINSNKIKQFELFYQLLTEYNKKMNLTSIITKEEVYGKHFYDSLTVILNNHLHGKVLDVGSGAGFPGIPLKIINPDLALDLLEPNQKKCLFLKTIIEELGFSNITVYNQRAEDFVISNRETYDVVIGRAVAPLPILLELCLPLTKTQGEFIALKGLNGLEELKKAQNAIKLLKGKVKDVDKQEYDGLTRYNIYITKINKTPKDYPRTYNKIKRTPL